MMRVRRGDGEEAPSEAVVEIEITTRARVVAAAEAEVQVIRTRK
jgi:hypothetical protein